MYVKQKQLNRSYDYSPQTKKQTSVQLWYPINPTPERFAHKGHPTDRLIFSDFPERTVTSNFPDVDINVVLQTKKGQQWSRPKDFGK